MDLISKENITLVIAVFGLIGSASMWAYKLVVQRSNFSVTILRKGIFGKDVTLFASFENKSRLPIAITRISLLIDGVVYDCVPVPTMVYEEVRRSRGEEVGRLQEFSIQMPIPLDSLSARSGFLHFELPEGILLSEPTALTFLISTNRSKTKRMTLPIPDAVYHRLGYTF